MTGILSAFAPSRRSGKVAGIPSVCSAHPAVIEAALRRGKSRAKAQFWRSCDPSNVKIVSIDAVKSGSRPSYISSTFATAAVRAARLRTEKWEEA